MNEEILMVVIVCLVAIGLLIYAHGIVEDNDKATRDKACQELGYWVSEYNNGWMCQDKDGYYHRVKFDCDWLVTSCNIEEIKFKSLGG